MPAITEQLFNILQTVQRPGTFYATGKCEVFPPHLEVEGVGRVALPLLGAQAEQLVAVAEVAPYGLGADTIPPDYHLEQDAIAGLLREWISGLSADTHQEIPEKLIYLLEHAYTSAELGFGALKGADSAVADAVLAASRQAGCEVHLALVSVEESGSAEYAGNGRY